MDTTHNVHSNQQYGYLNRSWKMLTAEKGWIKPVLVLAAIFCVPVVGSIMGALAITGYSLEWARLTAWGVDSVPKQRGVNVGGVLSSGWRGVAVSFVWALLGGLVMGVLTSLFSAVHLDFLGGIAQALVQLVLIAIVLIATLRAAIYQRFGAGFGVKQMYEMAQRDFGGLARVIGIQLLGVVVAGVVGGMLGVAMISTFIPAILTQVLPLMQGHQSYGYVTEQEQITMIFNILGMLAGAWPVFVLSKFCMGVVATISALLLETSCALWFRQFDVASWGSPKDPLPDTNSGSGPAPTL